MHTKLITAVHLCMIYFTVSLEQQPSQVSHITDTEAYPSLYIYTFYMPLLSILYSLLKYA